MQIEIAPQQSVTATIYSAAPQSHAGLTLILGHGAGANQASPFMVTIAAGLAARGIDTVTFNFLYSEQRRRVPDANDRLEACYRTVIETMRDHPRLGAYPLAIGGKSMGGRIASQVAASGVGPLAGLVFLGYPLHPPGKPDRLRDKHLSAIAAPMLFVQGARDAFGTPEELRPILETLQSAGLHVIGDGDHSFKVPKRAGVTQDEIYRGIEDRIDQWLRAIVAR